MYKEIEVYQIEYICRVLIDNGVMLSVLPNGTADGDDGNQYKCISHIDDDGDVVIDWLEMM